MEKQQKVLNKIAKVEKLGTSVVLGTKKNDECYTSMQDILNELSYWGDLRKFEGKNIICPCDWDIVEGEEIYSITITYKEDGVDVIGNNVYKAVKEVSYDLWSNDAEPVITKISLKEDEIEDFLKNKLTCNFIRTLTQNARRWGIKSITASGYNPANGKGVPFQEVNYKSYDVCITNPPFSLYPEFMQTVVGKIEFIVLAPYMNRANPSIGLPLMLKQCYLGVGRQLGLDFQNPTIQNKFHSKHVACDWITSFHEAQDDINNLHYKTNIKYENYKDDYITMPNMKMRDGTYPIRTLRSAFPDDYDGWMYSSIGILDFLDQSVYEWYGTHFIGYYNKTNPSANPFYDKASDAMLVDANGNHCFAGIVFRKKPQNKES